MQAAIERKPDPFAKKWDDLWKHEKLPVAFEVAGRRGGLVFTLNLSRKREQMLSCRIDPTDDLRRYISRELRAVLGSLPPFAFTFETAPNGRLHLHGVIVLSNRSASTLERVGSALCRAGGKQKARAAGRQCELKEITDGIGWASYVTKVIDKAMHQLGTHKVTYISNELTRQAKCFHSDIIQET
ncbi:hypothetical protein ACLIR7_07255 [Nitratireductor aquimarinus]|uniref:hypothetical protein n=1 Tax=Nitratireductor aquimarinus TaxID=889300 RepID=UPI00398EBDD8